jgi:hypothetical protein
VADWFAIESVALPPEDSMSWCGSRRRPAETARWSLRTCGAGCYLSNMVYQQGHQI